MLDTIAGAATDTSTRCAVFKIDLRGRFVYIDDETEEIFGIAREELFGRSIYDFISPGSVHILDRFLNRHNRYESFYEALPLMMRLSEGEEEFRPYQTIVTLNFISGNPVNYQFILVPPQSEILTAEPGYERRFLELTDQNPALLDYSAIAGLFCQVGGYAAGEVYLAENAGPLEAVGSYPDGAVPPTVPAHLEKFHRSVNEAGLQKERSESSPVHVGDSASEAAVILNLDSPRTLALYLHGPDKYRPSERQIADLRLLSRAWNNRFGQSVGRSSLGEKLSLLGRIGDVLHIGALVINENFTPLLINTSFSQFLEEGAEVSDADFRAVFKGLKFRQSSGEKLSFRTSAFAETVNKNSPITASYLYGEANQTVTVLGGPIVLDDATVFAFFLLSGAVSGNGPGGMPTVVTKLMSSVAHDVRAPLITIDAFAKRLQKQHADRLDKDGLFALDCLAQNIGILRGMIDGLVEMSRNWTRGQSPEIVDIGAVISELIVRLKATYPKTDYNVNVPDRLPEIVVSRQKITQLFHNLLDNAFKYSAGATQPIITLRYFREDDRHRFSIADNGPGIPVDYIEKIYNPFFRIPDDNLKALPGTGLGLTIVHDIVTSWGGTIHLDGTKGPGAVFSLTIPLESGG